MKKRVIMFSALLISLGLAGCHTMNSASQMGQSTVNYGTKTVGTGVTYGFKTVGAGVGVLSNTGAAVGRGIGHTTNWLVGQPVVSYHGEKVVYYKGHKYMLQHGKYVLVH
ncbi:MAG: hypothetical protein CK426_02950 [Legionella sp.]|nr:MAG: hypothetical protein CK423_09010 [Legionella sp.]PJD99344.1 MAG: hypothetical protein CK426_02950 [Legionella sp.]